MFAEKCTFIRKSGGPVRLAYLARRGPYVVGCNMKLHLRGRAGKWIVAHWRERWVDSVWTSKAEALGRAAELWQFEQAVQPVRKWAKV